MVSKACPRPNEQSVDLAPAGDATLRFIGTIRTPWSVREECPRQGRQDGPECRLVLDAPWHAALRGLEDYETIEVLYWLDRSRRDLVTQSPRGDGRTTGTFSLRSPVRPNPIGTSLVKLVRIDGETVVVRGLDCLDGRRFSTSSPTAARSRRRHRRSPRLTRADDDFRPPGPVGSGDHVRRFTMAWADAPNSSPRSSTVASVVVAMTWVPPSTSKLTVALTVPFGSRQRFPLVCCAR